MRTCVHGHECECKELDGKTRPLTWYCPALKKKMNKPWTDLCRKRGGGHYELWKYGTHEPSPKAVPLGPGPGTELLKMLDKPVKILGFLLRINMNGCGCAACARQMNAWGVAGCRERLDEITDHLQATAKRTKMPFNRPAAKALIEMAIRRAEK